MSKAIVLCLNQLKIWALSNCCVDCLNDLADCLSVQQIVSFLKHCLTVLQHCSNSFVKRYCNGAVNGGYYNGVVNGGKGRLLWCC